jgi:protein-tyrosine phosphatase
MPRGSLATSLSLPRDKATARRRGPCQGYHLIDLASRELVNTMSSILFVCTGNIFRSMTAEYALKASLAPGSQLLVSSAGTVAMPQEMHPDIRAYILRRGIDPAHHRQRRVSAELLDAADLVIAMSTDHQSFLYDTFRYRAPLFNDVCYGRSEPLLDIWEAIPTWETDPSAARLYMFQVMDYIWASMPELLQNLGTYLHAKRVGCKGFRAQNSSGARHA